MTIRPSDEKSNYEGKKGSHLSLPRRSQQERLIDLKMRQLRGESIEPRGHLEIVLSRIRPEPTPLYDIQQNPTGKGFISDPQARIFYLKHKFGFNIENEIDRSTRPARSFYWLVLDENGRPKMTAVEYAEEKTGKPRTKAAKPAAQPAPPPIITNEVGQGLMFIDDRPKPPASAWRDPGDRQEAR